MSSVQVNGHTPVLALTGAEPEPSPDRPHPVLTVAAPVGTNRPPSGPSVTLFPACPDSAAENVPLAWS